MIGIALLRPSRVDLCACPRSRARRSVNSNLLRNGFQARRRAVLPNCQDSAARCIMPPMGKQARGGEERAAKAGKTSTNPAPAATPPPPAAKANGGGGKEAA